MYLKTHQKNRVAVTGIGIMSAIGSETNSFYESLINSRTGCHQSNFGPFFVAEINSYELRFAFSKLELATLDRISQMAIKTAKEAVKSANLTNEILSSLNIYVGTGIGGITTLDEAYFKHHNDHSRISPATIPKVMPNAPASNISLYLKSTGECITYSMACASSAFAVGEAFRKIRDGNIDIALAGGCEAMLTPLIISAWNTLGVLCSTPESKPFSMDRNGFHLGEGSAFLIIENLKSAIKRGARIYAEISGYGTSSDAMHLTKPSIDGQVRAMSAALADSNLYEHDINLINAHGTATELGDHIEARSINLLFKSNPFVTATKGLHGHAIGATGVMELIATILSINNSTIPPIPFFSSESAMSDLNLILNTPHECELNHALSNSFAFGGSNACLIVSKFTN